MSKLADRIRKAAKAEPAPIGFAALTPRKPNPSLLIVLRTEVGKAAEAVSAGADAVIIEADAAKLRSAKLPDGAVVGVIAAKADRKEASALREAGADFLVVDKSSAASALLDEKLGFVLNAPLTAEDTQLRVMGDLGPDAVLTQSPQPPLTVSDVLALRRVAGFTRAPLLVEAGAEADAETLQLLRESGAIGIVVPASAAGKLGDLRSRIEALPPRGARKRGEGAEQPLVPVTATTGHDHEEDDDYDD